MSVHSGAKEPSVSASGSSAASGSTSPSAPAFRPLVTGGAAVIDLRTRPTRQSLGMPAGKIVSGYGRRSADELVNVTLLLSRDRRVELPAYGIAVESGGDPTKPAADPTTAPPTSTVINCRFTSRAAELAVLDQLVTAFAINPDDVALAGAGPGSQAVPHGNLVGRREGFLLTDVDLRGRAGDYQLNVQLLYDFGPVPGEQAPTTRGS